MHCFHIRLQEIEAEFDKHVSIKDITSQQLDIDPDSIIYIYNYWKLKRRVSGRYKSINTKISRWIRFIIRVYITFLGRS